MQGISVSADQLAAQAHEKATVLSGGEKRRLDLAKLFALFTSGYKWRIILPPAAGAAALAAVVCFLAAAVLLVLYAESPASLLLCQFSFILLYTLIYGKLLSQKLKAEFKRMIGRKG